MIFNDHSALLVVVFVMAILFVLIVSGSKSIQRPHNASSRTCAGCQTMHPPTPASAAAAASKSREIL